MLSLQNVTHTYPNGVRALKNINLEIGKGMFGLLGPNGAGKSSLIRTIATLQKPDTGSVFFSGVDAINQPMALRRILGYLPQDFGVYPRGSAYDIMNYIAALKGLTNSRERKRAVEHLLVETNLYDDRHRRLAGFSGGMRRRFGIAQALIGDPQLIIVDEPTAGLDPEERNRFHNLLAEVAEKRVILLSTHIIEDVTDLCSDMAVLMAGRLLLKGRPSRLVQEMKGRIWSKMVQKSEIPDHERNHFLISSHLSEGQTRIRIVSASHPGEGFEPTQPQLSDVYFCALKGLMDKSGD